MLVVIFRLSMFSMKFTSVCLPQSIRSITGAIFVTYKPVQPWGAESLLAVRAFKACVTQTGAVDVVTLGPILTVAVEGTLLAVCTDRALLLAPGTSDILY